MMKKFFLLVILSMAIMSSYAQIIYSPFQTQWSKDSQGNQILTYNNIDYCDYYLVWTNGETMCLRPGNNIVRRISAANKNYQKITQADGYRYYKGEFIQNFNPKIVYSLPVKNNDSIKCNLDKSKRELTFVFLTKPQDTIYACRAGVVCKDDTKDFTLKYYNPKSSEKILIYHKDKTFAEYSNFSQIFVIPGESVSMGDPIGIISKPLTIAFFFLDKNKFTATESGRKHSHFTPLFETKESGATKLEYNTKYTAYCSDSTKMQDMSKREIKKFIKNKTK